MDIQRLRNLTTRIMHTNISHVCQDLEYLLGEPGIMTHMLPNALNAVDPWLRQHITEQRFWDKQYDTTHVGEINIPEPTDKDRETMFNLFHVQPDPLSGKKIIAALLPEKYRC